MPTYTANYNLAKPLPFDLTDSDLWGGQLNTDLDTIDGLFKRAINWNYSSKGGNYTVTSADYKTFFAANASTAPFTITLPPVMTNAGLNIAIKKVDSTGNAVTIQANGAELIDGSNTLILRQQYDSVNLISTGTEWVTLSRTQGVETGIIEIWGGTTSNIPVGYLACDGSAVSRTTYSALFAKISTTYGAGDGTTTFNLPPLNKGYFVRGISSDASIDPAGPRSPGSIQQDALKNHDHTLANATNGGSAGSLIYRVTAFTSSLTAYLTGNGAGAPYTSGTSDAAPETRPKNIALCYIIKT